MTWWTKLPSRTSAWITMVSVVCALAASVFGFGAVSATSGMPERLDTLEAHELVQDRTLEVMQEVDIRQAQASDKIICLLLLPEGTLPLQAEQDCK